MALLQKRQPLKLRIELVPEYLWGKNLRSNEGLGKWRWDKLRREIIKKNNARCATCGSTKTLHGHEVWQYREKKTVGVATLLRVEISCINCHDIRHWGRTTELFKAGKISEDRFRFLIKHFCKVNRCSQKVFAEHGRRSARASLRRSKKKWRTDWGPFKPMVDEAKAAREAWAARNPNHGSQEDAFDVRPGHHMQNQCPDCGAIGTLTRIEADRSAMSEGQEADYDAGTWGFAFCRACRSTVFWQV
jgi:ribosomal protein S27AE